MEKEGYTLQEISRRFGWSPAWVRKLEALGLFGELDAPKGRRGPVRKLYSDHDLVQIMWIATLRHAGVELDELRTYKSFADDLIELLERYQINALLEGGDEVSPLFLHQPNRVYRFYIDWTKFSEIDLVQAAKWSEWFQAENKRIRERVELWLVQNQTIRDWLTDLRDSATKASLSMGKINNGAVKHRALKRG